MAISRKRALERGQQAIERPKARMRITLFHGKGGVTLRYEGQVVARTHASGVGRMLAPYLARALGVSLPPVGGKTEAVISSGVLYRVLSISTLDLRQKEAGLLLEYLLREAEEMREYRSSQV